MEYTLEHLLQYRIHAMDSVLRSLYYCKVKKKLNLCPRTEKKDQHVAQNVSPQARQ